MFSRKYFYFRKRIYSGAAWCNHIKCNIYINGKLQNTPETLIFSFKVKTKYIGRHTTLKLHGPCRYNICSVNAVVQSSLDNPVQSRPCTFYTTDVAGEDYSRGMLMFCNLTQICCIWVEKQYLNCFKYGLKMYQINNKQCWYIYNTYNKIISSVYKVIILNFLCLFLVVNTFWEVLLYLIQYLSIGKTLRLSFISFVPYNHFYCNKSLNQRPFFIHVKIVCMSIHYTQHMSTSYCV